MGDAYSYTKVRELLNQIYEIDDYLKDNLYLAGGLVPYIVFNIDSNRLHSDIDFICDIQNIDAIKDIFYKNNSFNQINDSKDYLEKDHGFEMLFNDFKVGVYPFESINEEIRQYSYDSERHKGKLKTVSLLKNEYITKYHNINAMSLETILKSKILDCREKDKADIDLICKNGFDSTKYSKVNIKVIY